MKQVTNIFLEGEKAALIRKTWSKVCKIYLKMRQQELRYQKTEHLIDATEAINGN